MMMAEAGVVLRLAVLLKSSSNLVVPAKSGAGVRAQTCFSGRRCPGAWSEVSGSDYSARERGREEE
jgi:hypothetical protein